MCALRFYWGQNCRASKGTHVKRRPALLARVIDMDERVQWIAFKKEARIKHPSGHKQYWRYYKGVRVAYKAQVDNHPTDARTEATMM